MNTSRWTIIGIGAISLMLAAWVGLYFFSANADSNTRTQGAVTDPTKCPICGRPLSKQSRGDICSACKAEGRTLPGQKSLLGGATVPVALISMMVILAGIHLGRFFWKHRQENKAEVVCYIECPKCHRRLRYREAQIGKPGKCPLCGRPMIFPVPEYEPKPSAWSRIRQLLAFHN
jgi:hypothetical protein